ncbi:SGNH hydrolase-type esterase domain-containing protein [Leptodontidium sp. MPI-SDFR-AT-0119]|nr:SGNH hydrolase-type esterase domain-containing protein [Leptodontidium sp. MPI-SDFR-AT-0119]
MSPFVRFSFRSCSSAKIDDVQTKQLPELQADNIADQHLVLLSIGGNDADFATLVDACITQAWYGSCDKRLAVANENIDRLAPKIEKLFKNIVRAVRDAEGNLNFRMIVTGYPRFFNSETTLCNTRSMGFWPLWKPKLTQELRRTINGLVDRMNHYLEANVEIANEELGRDRVFYVDPNPEFDGHRFCEEGVMEPDDSTNSPSWFFLLRGTDRESVVEDPVQLVPDECDRLLALESVTLGDEWGRQMMCAIGKHMSEGMIPEPWVGVDGTDPNQLFLPEQYAKFFHPKTAGHAAYKRAIMRTLQTIQDRPLRAATVMHRGTPEQFAELRDSFGTNPFNPVRVLQQDGIDVRGFLTWMTVDTAVAVKASRSDVLGVSYEDESMTRDSVAGREPTFPSKSRRSRVPAGQEQVAKQVPERRATFVRRADGDGGVSALAQEPVTNTNLDMQYAIVPEREWHLNMISTPPAFPPEDATQQDRLYFKYPGYVYDPNAGDDVAVYSMDMGANLDHLTLKGRVGSTFVAGNWPQGDGKLDHGTCMASLTSGSTVGVNRGGTINIVKYLHNGQLASITRADMLLESLLWILKDVRDKGKQKRAVISFSTGEKYSRASVSFAQS